MDNVKDAVQVAEHVYPSSSHTIMWVFDQSSCHRVYADDAFNVRRMNVRPGGTQPVMRDTMWERRVQRMVMEDGMLKGMKMVLEERREE